MNIDELQAWHDDVLEHCHTRDIVVNDRIILKTELEKHLKQFFDYDEIQVDKDFKSIKLIYDANVSPIIRENISELGMEFMVHSSYDDSANRIIIIELFPFGIIED